MHTSQAKPSQAKPSQKKKKKKKKGKKMDLLYCSVMITFARLSFLPVSAKLVSTFLCHFLSSV
jgi:hypothetical protein